MDIVIWNIFHVSMHELLYKFTRSPLWYLLEDVNNYFNLIAPVLGRPYKYVIGFWGTTDTSEMINNDTVYAVTVKLDTKCAQRINMNRQNNSLCSQGKYLCYRISPNTNEGLAVLQIHVNSMWPSSKHWSGGRNQYGLGWRPRME